MSSDLAYYHPAMTNYLPDQHSVKLEFEYKEFPRYTLKSSFENSKSGSNNEQYVNLYYVSPKIYNGRITFSHKRDTSTGVNSSWDGAITRQSANSFELKNTQTQLGYAHSFNDLTLFAGIQRVHKQGDTTAYPAGNTLINSADGDRYGPIFGLSYRFQPWLYLSLNYNTQLDVTLKGNNYNNISGKIPAQAEISHPERFGATIFLYTSQEALWILGAEKKFWSSYKALDIDYADPTVESIFGAPLARKWEDIMIYKFGHQHSFNDLKVLGLIAYAEDQVPNETRNFPVPGGKVMAYIFRTDYKLNDSIDLSATYKYIDYDDSYSNLHNADFSTNGAHVMNLGVQYNF